MPFPHWLNSHLEFAVLGDSVEELFWFTGAGFRCKCLFAEQLQMLCGRRQIRPKRTHLHVQLATISKVAVNICHSEYVSRFS